MPRRVAAPKADVPYLHAKQIEAEADLLIAEYGERYDVVVAPPIPADELAELHLQLTLEYLDMQSLFPNADVHGAIWFEDGRIGIEQSLDPDSNPNRQGRYHFTLAHEIGHWRLHRTYYLKNPHERRLFDDGTSRPDVVCRSGDTQPVEWQANAFASNLLMPRQMVQAAWTDFREGNDRPVSIDELREMFADVMEVEPLYYRGRMATDPASQDIAMKEEFCRPMADRFEVSREAMRIRLEQLGLLVLKKENTLF